MQAKQRKKIYIHWICVSIVWSCRHSSLLYCCTHIDPVVEMSFIHCTYIYIPIYSSVTLLIIIGTTFLFSLLFMRKMNRFEHFIYYLSVPFVANFHWMIGIISFKNNNAIRNCAFHSIFRYQYWLYIEVYMGFRTLFSFFWLSWPASNNWLIGKIFTTICFFSSGN